MPVDLDVAYELDDRVSLRPEPFGALAYHFGNRRLSFLRSPDIVAVVRTLGDHDSLADTLAAEGIDPGRWPSFTKALDALERSDMIRRRPVGPDCDPADHDPADHDPEDHDPTEVGR